MQAEMLDSVVSSNSQELPNASSALKLFENPQFRVRVIMRLGDPWFVASDACDGLAISNARDALANIDDDDKLKLTIGRDRYRSFNRRYQMFSGFACTVT